jgi:hypothetical protein
MTVLQDQTHEDTKLCKKCKTVYVNRFQYILSLYDQYTYPLSSPLTRIVLQFKLTAFHLRKIH